MTSMSRLWSVAVVVGLTGFLSGCGGSKPAAPVAETSPTAVAEEESGGLMTVAIPGLKPATPKPKAPGTTPAATTPAKGTATAPAETAATPAKKEPVKGSPEWLLREIQYIKVMPLPESEDASKTKSAPKTDAELEMEDDEKPLTPEEEQKLKAHFEKTKAIRRDRNLQIIKLSEECIAKTAKTPELEPEFDAAVHYLLDARLQLALQGDDASIEALFDAAKVFYERKPTSAAALEAELTLVNLTHANAIRYGQAQPKWIQEFAKHAQLYAARFPDEQARSVKLLAAAARTCELSGLSDDARSCYTLLITKFKDTPEAQQAEGVVRRLQLKGKTLEFTGPTIDGGDLNIASYKGKMVVIVFWATHAKPFIDQLPKLTATMKKYEKYATVVGVNLDADEGAVEAFVEETKLTWPQIFSPNRALRGWNSPLAVHYGINTLPTIWLVDPNGIVTDTSINAENLETRLREVYLPFLKATAKPAGAAN